MTPLGKALVFYLKYWAEMQNLYASEHEGREPYLKGLQDADRVQEMARIVGDAASEQAADFLERCGNAIDEHFGNLDNVKLSNRRSRAFMNRYWEWGTRVNITGLPGGWFSCGVFLSAPPDVQITIDKDACGVVVPWIWTKGGRNGADVVWKVVGKWADSRAGGGLVIENGSVALALILIRAQPPESFEVESEPLVAELMRTITRLGAKQTNDIAKFVAGLGEGDEA
jgi:hypothetical protein